MKYLYNIGIIVSLPEKNTLGFILGGSCAWEEEHGYEIIVNDGRVKYVGQYDYSSAWCNSYSSDFNYSLKK